MQECDATGDDSSNAAGLRIMLNEEGHLAFNTQHST